MPLPLEKAENEFLTSINAEVLFWCQNNGGYAQLVIGMEGAL
jgi:hypothetical protein